MCISFAQVTTQIQDVLLNNQTTVSNCGLIDVGSTNNNTLTVAFKLSKLENQAVGTILVTVYLKRFGTSDPGTNKGVYSVPSNVWTTQFESQIPINFSASEIELTGSSIYVKSTENSTFLSNSCEYPLKKECGSNIHTLAYDSSNTLWFYKPSNFCGWQCKYPVGQHFRICLDNRQRLEVYHWECGSSHLYQFVSFIDIGAQCQSTGQCECSS